jgi:hypothetical protein
MLASRRPSLREGSGWRACSRLVSYFSSGNSEVLRERRRRVGLELARARDLEHRLWRARGPRARQAKAQEHTRALEPELLAWTSHRAHLSREPTRSSARGGVSRRLFAVVH